MGLLQTFLEILRLDTPPRRPTTDDYCSVEQERINLEHKCAVYERELLRNGYRKETLKAMVASNLTEVRAS